MKYEIVGGTGISPKIAILCPRIEKNQIKKHYYDPFLKVLGQDVMVCDLFIDRTKKKTTAADIKEYLNDLLPHLIDAGIEIILLTNSEYFKVLTKQRKSDATIGDIIPTVTPLLKAAYLPNYGRIFHDPDKTRDKISIALGSVIRHVRGDTSRIGQNIIKTKMYPQTEQEILDALNMLYQMDVDLTCDIEGFSLKHYDSGIGTITFCWNENEGVAFAIDYVPLSDPIDGVYGQYIPNPKLKKALRRFFEKFTRKIIYHNVAFDVYVLIYQLFMDHLLDQDGLLTGLEVMLKNWDCTQLITYLATNSCAGNELSLKAQAQEYAGNYAQEEIKDIRRIPLPQLLEYNLTDGLSTWFTYKKNHPVMVADDQLWIYENIFKPATIDIIQMQLTGMPINMAKVQALDLQLNQESQALVQNMLSMSLVQQFIDYLGDEIIAKKNAKLKKKQITRADLGKTKDTIVEFNPNSSDQLQKLLYHEDFLGLPVVDYTDSKAPATGAETLEKLKFHTNDPGVLSFLDILIEYKASAIIISTFLPAFLKAKQGPDGWHYLFGNFRLGGTASGRLSSNNPNLQNIPASSDQPAKKRLAKLIKECFEAPPGWLFVGLDFESLEDKISAVTTRDPEKIKVYTDGYDGHCLRALAYFGDQMPDIEPCPEGATAYRVEVNGVPIYFHSEEKVNYLGQDMLGVDLYNLIVKGLPNAQVS